MKSMKKFNDEDYINCDPFYGETDVDIRCRTVKIIVAAKDHKCSSCLLDQKEHIIKAGEKARVEKAIVDGSWCSYYSCIPSLNRLLMELEGACCYECESWDYKNAENGNSKCMNRDSENHEKIMHDSESCVYFVSADEE